MKEASLYVRLDGQTVHCQLCAHNCKIQEGKFGFCGVRQNIKGVLYTHNYGKLVAVNVDPVEKKPLNHFLPGSLAFSIASAGCNFRCGFCQNWQISQLDFLKDHPGEDFSAAKVIELAKQNNCKSIAYTYTEPTIFFEFALETAILAKQEGIANIFVTNGYMTAKAISVLKPHLDTANVDLKFFKESSYQRICSAKLAPVLDSIRLLYDTGVWVEITTLLIPGENDSPEELSGIAKFISGISKDIPWHVSSFHADYKFTSYSNTPEQTLKAAYDLGKAQGLRYVYAGNAYGWGQDTFCIQCKRVIIKREGFNITESSLAGNKCKFCQAILPGVFS
ncbi:MAG: AmmeMemoRadiSam system radical SAM enzyme [Candidatus Omnitrophica bacterium]|nr:AmmeMemoRadiSam system radical SAM enzyme [Candidatus Omnitrophota bacterium]